MILGKRESATYRFSATAGSLDSIANQVVLCQSFLGEALTLSGTSILNTIERVEMLLMSTRSMCCPGCRPCFVNFFLDLVLSISFCQ